jgi:hypothetical protein
MSKEPQKTNTGKKPPLRVAEGPPDTAEGRRAYSEGSLEKSADYKDERSADSGKPYTAENEALRDQARKSEQSDKR